MQIPPSLVIWGVHDHKWMVDNSTQALLTLSGDINASLEHPLDTCLVVGGDMNRTRVGELRFYHDPLDQANYLNSPSLHSDNRSSQHLKWDRQLDRLVEVDTHGFTHFSAEGRFESRIDRIWWSIPPWISRLMNVSKSVFPPAHSFHTSGTSDHAPVGIKLHPRTPRPLRSVLSLASLLKVKNI